MSRKVSERFFSKIEVFALRFIFKQLAEQIKANPDRDPKELAESMPMYNRAMLRQSFGIQRLLFEDKDDHVLVVIGLEDRTQNYTMKITKTGE